jgi:hypothetical protein
MARVPKVAHENIFLARGIHWSRFFPDQPSYIMKYIYEGV